MRLPWISRSAYETVLGLVTAQVVELKEERKILLDRLAILGLGGALYSTSPPEEQGAESEPAPSPEQMIMEQLMQLRHRPAKLADALTWRARRTHEKRAAGDKVAWLPQLDKIQAALDFAEELGKKSAAGSA